MPVRKNISAVTFDRAIIRQKPEAQHYTFKEARRLQGSVYDALLQEFYEENCTYGAFYFNQLVKHESVLLRKNYIGRLVSDDRKFLFELTDKCKMAEKLYNTGDCDSVVQCLKMLYECLLLLESDKLYNWLLSEFYAIVITKIESMESEIMHNEIKMRIYYKYGLFLEPTDLEPAIEAFKKSFDICCGQSWVPDIETEIELYDTMHEAVGYKLSRILVRYSRQFLRSKKFDMALQMSHEAVVTMSKVGLIKHKNLVYETSIDHIECMVECQQYNEALKMAAMIREHVMKDQTEAFIPLKCRLLFQCGICYYFLNNYTKALWKFRQALTISQQNGLRTLQGEILLHTGRAHAFSEKQESRARDAFMRARQIFIETEDLCNKKKADYYLAKLKADLIFPSFKKMLSSKDFCQFYSLRQWKNLCKPFWQENTGTVMLSKRTVCNLFDETGYMMHENLRMPEKTLHEVDEEEHVPQLVGVVHVADQKPVTSSSDSDVIAERFGFTETRQSLMMPLKRSIVRRDLLCLTREFEKDI